VGEATTVREVEADAPPVGLGGVASSAWAES